MNTKMEVKDLEIDDAAKRYRQVTKEIQSLERHKAQLREHLMTLLGDRMQSETDRYKVFKVYYHMLQLDMERLKEFIDVSEFQTLRPVTQLRVQER